MSKIQTRAYFQRQHKGARKTNKSPKDVRLKQEASETPVNNDKTPTLGTPHFTENSSDPEPQKVAPLRPPNQPRNHTWFCTEPATPNQPMCRRAAEWTRPDWTMQRTAWSTILTDTACSKTSVPKTRRFPKLEDRSSQTISGSRAAISRSGNKRGHAGEK